MEGWIFSAPLFIPKKIKKGPSVKQTYFSRRIRVVDQEGVSYEKMHQLGFDLIKIVECKKSNIG